LDIKIVHLFGKVKVILESSLTITNIYLLTQTYLKNINNDFS